MLMKLFIFNLLENSYPFFLTPLFPSFFSKPEVKLMFVLRTENKDFFPMSKYPFNFFEIRV
jgi:hypothetical protein